MISKDLVAASSKPLILSILMKEESYGYEIIMKVKALSSEKLLWKEGMLYPVLHKMENEDLIKSFWRTSDNKRKRKYYRITSKGKLALKVQRQQWETVNSVFNRLWELEPCLN